MRRMQTVPQGTERILKDRKKGIEKSNYDVDWQQKGILYGPAELHNWLS